MVIIPWVLCSYHHQCLLPSINKYSDSKLQSYLGSCVWSITRIHCPPLMSARFKITVIPGALCPLHYQDLPPSIHRYHIQRNSLHSWSLPFLVLADRNQEIKWCRQHQLFPVHCLLVYLHKVKTKFYIYYITLFNTKSLTFSDFKSTF